MHWFYSWISFLCAILAFYLDYLIRLPLNLRNKHDVAKLILKWLKTYVGFYFLHTFCAMIMQFKILDKIINNSKLLVIFKILFRRWQNVVL